MTPGAYTQLSLDLNMYLGGVLNSDVISPKIKVKNSFVGCIQKVSKISFCTFNNFHNNHPNYGDYDCNKVLFDRWL